MYPKIFNRCIDVLLELEGGDKISNSSSDSGGLTKYGISQKAYPELNIKALTKEMASDIYYNDYWVPMIIEEIPNQLLVLHLFVFGVNAGIRTSIRLLQRLVGVKDDGYIGAKTIKAIKNFNGDILQKFIEKEKEFYVLLVKKHPDQEVNLKGWINRVNLCHF
jgi:lysozyme family protein